MRLRAKDLGTGERYVLVVFVFPCFISDLVCLVLISPPPPPPPISGYCVHKSRETETTRPEENKDNDKAKDQVKGKL
jgi:hypothetical protein